MTNIGFKIKKLRESKNMTQPQLAHQLNISQSTLSFIENGETKKIDFLMMENVCNLFNVDLEYFTTDNYIHIDVKEATNSNVSFKNKKSIVNNNFPENLIEQIKKIVEENYHLKHQNEELNKKLGNK